MIHTAEHSPDSSQASCTHAPVSYTHLDVYKRQRIGDAKEVYVTSL